MRELSLSPQCRKILSHLEKVGHITSRSAIMDYSIASLTRRIKDLREFGIKIKSEWRVHPTTKQRYTNYVLVRA